MNSLELVVASMTRQKAERLPVYPILSGVTRNLIGVDYVDWATKADVCAEALIKAQETLGIDCFCTLTDLSVEAADFGQEVIFPRNEAAHPNFDNHFIKSIEDYSKIAKIDPRTSPRMSEHIKLCKILVEKKGKEVPVVAFMFGPLGILSMLRGQEDLYMDLYDEPEIVLNAVNTITDVLIEYSKALIEVGVHAIMLDTLFASGSIMSKDMWNEFEGPATEKWADFMHTTGCMVMIHNCGKQIYFDVQIERMKPAAISFLYPPDDCKDYVETKQKYGDKTMLIGAILPTWLPHATTDEVKAESKKQIKEMGKGGGFMLATGCEYPANLSLDNAKAMVATINEIGDKYFD